MEFFRQTINILADVLIFLIFARVILSWFIHSDQGFLMHFLHEVTEPIMAPVRKVLPNFQGLDFSPIVVFIIIDIARNMLNSMLV
jgi:YggT family protein